MRLRSAALFTFVLATALTARGAFAETKRIAVVVGNNAGSDDVQPLRYAENDAGKMARVLAELGEVSPDDVLLLQGRRLFDLEHALADTAERVAAFHKAPEVRTVVLFFFSGHSDGESLELGHEKVTYARLRSLLSATGSDVRIAIIDACRSGGGLLQKGGKPAEAFTIKLNDQLNASGDAFITSSAADEAALESSEVMGSYFTHHLISGLRGAADTSRDHLVTLAEAYRYAYDRTVTATSVLPVGAQHPSYDFKLSGQGELVLSSLVKPSAMIVLPDGAERSLVSDIARDQVVVEVPSNGVREVALPPGQYAVRVFKGTQAYGTRLALTEGVRRVVAWPEMTLLATREVIATKGHVTDDGSVRAVSVNDTAPIGLSVEVGLTGRVLVDPTNPGGPFKYQVRLGFEPLTTAFGTFNLFARPRLGAVQARGELVIGLVGESSFEATAPGRTEADNEAGAQVRLGYRISFEWWRLALGVGVEAGAGVLAQRYGDHTATGVVLVVPRATMRLHLVGPVSLSLNAEAPIVGVTLQDPVGQSLHWLSFGALNAGVVIGL